MSLMSFCQRTRHTFAAKEKLSRPRFRATRSLQYFGCRWQRWQVTYTRSVDTKRRCDLQDTPPRRGDTAPRETRYTHPRGLPPPSLVVSTPFPSSLRSPPHTCSTCLYVKLEVLVIVWRGGRLTFRNVSSTSPDFLSPDRVKEERGHIAEKGWKEKIFFTMRGIYIGDIRCPLSAAILFQIHPNSRTFACTIYLKKERDSTLSSPFVGSSSRFIAVPDTAVIPCFLSSHPCPFASRGRAPFRNLPMVKGCLEDCASFGLESEILIF